MERKTNMEILQEIGREYEVINTIKVRKLQYLGHIMRGHAWINYARKDKRKKECRQTGNFMPEKFERLV